MNLSHAFNKEEHDQTVIDCFLQMWRYSADLMFIMAVEEDDEFSLYDNNPASKTVMGLEEGAEIHRLNLRMQFGDEMAEQVYATYRQVLQAKTPISIEQTGVRGDGSRIYFDTLFVPIFDELGKPIFVCGVSRDITKIKDAESVALKANEKLLEYSVALETINQDLDRKVQERTKELESAKRTVEESLEAKSSFVARMSHEIRTPINAVIGLSHLSLKTSLNDEQQDCMNKILASGEVLLSLVNDVLDFSKIEAGKMSIETVPFSPRLIVQHAINMNTTKAQEKKLALTVDISASLPPMLLGDPLRIQQVLVNLVTNAVKFTERGGVCVRVYSDTNNGQGVLLRCDVIDTGIGISKTNIKQLFQSFQQADDSITRVFGGTGLGLTISRQLCDIMGGDIWVNSEIGHGSTFSFTLPLNVSSSTSLPIDPTLNEENNIPDLSQYNLLLAEDNLINQKVILGYLDDTSINVDVAGNGEDAINKLDSKNYDIVLMDIQMPIMDGLTATKHIRSSSVYGNIPIIAMTAHVSEDAKKQSAQAGMNAHLDKPIKKIDLYKTLQKHLHAETQDNPLKMNDLFVSNQDSSYVEVLSKMSSIDTLDIKGAINNLGGKTSLYLDLVTAFYNKYKVVTIDGCLESNIVDIIHSLKSNSAYIGAFDLSLHCSELERNIQNNMISSKLLERLVQTVNKLAYELEKVLIPYNSLINSDEGDRTFCADELASKLEVIVPLLKKSDFFVENHFSLLRKMVRGTKYALDIEHLIFDIKDVEFEVAAVKASQLIFELQGN
jgi:two-component system sensor histidine kinase/response regulator